MTEWRPVLGYESTYRVSDEGEVVSLPRNTTSGGPLTQTVERGYPVVTLTQDGVWTKHAVHRIVAAAFFGPRPEGLEVRHLNGDRGNPSVSNLAYGTRSENSRDRRAHGTDINVNKTHCPKGHQYDEANTYVLPSRPNARYCKACQRASAIERRHRRRVSQMQPGWRDEWGTQ